MPMKLVSTARRRSILPGRSLPLCWNDCSEGSGSGTFGTLILRLLDSKIYLGRKFVVVNRHSLAEYPKYFDIKASMINLNLKLALDTRNHEHSNYGLPPPSSTQFSTPSALRLD
jgi:hypothetical protein